jgi:hypothetical protein
MNIDCNPVADSDNNNSGFKSTKSKNGVPTEKMFDPIRTNTTSTTSTTSTSSTSPTLPKEPKALKQPTQKMVYQQKRYSNQSQQKTTTSML